MVTQRLPPETQRLIEEARAGEKQPARQHHLVPASYLARWTDPKHLRVTDRLTGKSHLSAPDAAASQRDFYSLAAPDIDPDELPPLLYEKLLGTIEGRARAIIDKIIGGGPGWVRHSARLSGEDAAWFSWFLATQATRGRAFRARADWIVNEYHMLLYRDATDAGLAHRLREADMDAGPEAVADFRTFVDGLGSGRVKVSNQRAALVGDSSDLARVLGGLFIFRDWFLYHAAYGDLVTTDEPVVALGGPRRSRREQPGFATAGAVVFPLDPRHLLVMFHPGLDLDEVAEVPDLLPTESAEVNRELVATASRWVFERPRSHVGQLFARRRLPPASSRQPFHSVDGSRSELHRIYHVSPWSSSCAPPPWPVARWWRCATGPGADRAPMIVPAISDDKASSA